MNDAGLDNHWLCCPCVSPIGPLVGCSTKRRTRVAKTSRYALHHLPDFWKAVALARVHQVLRPGGVLRLWDVVYSFNPAEAGVRIESWCSTGKTTADEGWSRGELEEHVRDEHSTYTWLLEPIIQRSGFAIEDAEVSDDGIFAKYVLRRSGVAQ